MLFYYSRIFENISFANAYVCNQVETTRGKLFILSLELILIKWVSVEDQTPQFTTF